MFGNSGRLLSSGFVTRVLMVSMLGLLCACGGGGGGSSGGGGGTTPPKLTANAGADITVNMGTRVDLDPKVLVAGVTSATLNADGLDMTGSSAIDEQVVKLVWKKIEGPAIALSSSGFNDGKIYFTAPNVTTTTNIVFKLTLTNAAGRTAEDSVTITVKRVNLAPSANAGTTQDVKAGTQVTLDGSASKDTDGSIAKYNWKQKSGTQVALTGETTAKASFLAPTVSANTELQFELTVEDNEGATATQNVTVKVTPANVPEVALYFPPAVGVYTGSSISAFGNAKVAEGQISAVTVEIGGVQTAATLSGNGDWRADNLSVPLGSSFTIKVTATDDQGRSGQNTATLNKSGAIGSGPSVDDILGFEVDSSLNKLILLTAGKTLGSTRLLSIDMANGKRSANISSFGDANQGPTNEALGQMTYDPVGKKAYVSGAPADLTVSPFIISIDTLTGQRSLIASNTKGAGAALDFPYGIAYNKGSLYIADILTDKILKLDPATGNRITIADKDTAFYIIDAPALLAIDQHADDPLLYLMPNATQGFVLGLTTDTNSALSDLITDSSESADGPAIIDLPKSLVADEALHKLYVLTKTYDVVEVDTWTGKRKTLLSNSTLFGTEKMTYDPIKHVMYLIDHFPLAVSAMDPVSGQRVLINSSGF